MRGRISERVILVDFFGRRAISLVCQLEGVMKVLENRKRCGLEDAEGEARRAGGFVAIALGDGRVERLEGDREGS